MRYFVGIRKDYFPRGSWSSDLLPGDAFYAVVEVEAWDRVRAAHEAWLLNGHDWLLEMGPARTRVRIISLDVNDPGAGPGGILGRLQPIEVYRESRITQ